MKKVIFILIFLCICLESFCFSYNSSSVQDSVSEKRDAFGILKINPFQFMFCEIPVSLEIYRSRNHSLQIQVGYIFPARNTFMADFFESWGVENHAQDGYLISYKRSPYNNDGGINIKIEFRMYKTDMSIARGEPYNSAYFAPQLMFKYNYYNNQTFTKKDGTNTSDFTYDSTESKDLSTFGLGLIFGRQSCNGKFVSDFYWGFGIRFTGIRSTVYEKDYGTHVQYPNTTEGYVKLFPFFNFGWRMGLEFKS